MVEPLFKNWKHKYVYGVEFIVGQLIEIAEVCVQVDLKMW